MRVVDQPHIVRDIPLDGQQFLDDIDYRIHVLKNVKKAIVDGLYNIRSILRAFYDNYFNSNLFENDFSTKDQIILRYLVAKEILGNLFEYNRIDHKSVPLKYNILARNYSNLISASMHHRGSVTDNEILVTLNTINIEDSELADISNLMQEIKDDGIIQIIIRDKEHHYEINRPLELSPEGKEHYGIFLCPIVDWPTGFWESFYNIRELNLVPDENVQHRDFLLETLFRTATQGYSSVHFVFKNLIKYYKMIRDEETR